VTEITKGVDGFGAFKQIQDHRDNLHSPYKLAFIRSDQGTEFDNKVFEEWCNNNGVTHEWSGRYRHDQNGVTERRVQSWGVAFRCMMLQGNAPEIDASFAVKHGNTVINNSPTKANNGKTPKEVELGQSLPFNRRLARAPLFCLAFAHVYKTEPARAGNKDAARAVVCVYLGFDDTSYQYIVKEWSTGTIFYTADADFQPTRFPYRANPNTMGEFLYQYEDIRPYTGVQFEGKQNSSSQMPGRRYSTRVHDRTHSGGFNIANLPDTDVPPAQPIDASALLVLPYNPEPANWEEAMTQVDFQNDWILAKLAEMRSFQEHGVYELVPRTEAKGKRIFRNREVLKVKMHPPTPEHPVGLIDKFKYRLTIAAFTRMLKQGIDYVEKHASQVRWEAVKVLLAIAVYMGYEIWLIDLCTFFLYGSLKDEPSPVFMEQPESWATADKPASDWVWKLLKSMYGLPHAHNNAHKELDAALTDGGFHSTDSDDCVYTLPKSSIDSGEGYAATGVHVDDCVVIGTKAGIKKIKQSLEAKFKITEQANPTHITGVEIERNFEARWLKLHQTNFTSDLLKRHGMMDCNAADTPMDAGTAKVLMMLPVPNSKTSEGPAPDANIVKRYQSLVGDLVWLRIRTRPDLAYTVSLLSRFCSCATQAHFDIACKRPLRYLKGTISDGIVFSPGAGEWLLTGTGDADLAGDLNTQRSMLGHYLSVGQYGAIITQCGLERKLCTSTGQAETYAMAAMVKDVMWLRGLLHELHFPMREPTPLDTDNDGVFKQSTKAINHTTAKHYRISQAFIRSKVKAMMIKVSSVNTIYNAADIFTKALGRELFLHHKGTMMGPQSPPEHAAI